MYWAHSGKKKFLMTSESHCLILSHEQLSALNFLVCFQALEFNVIRNDCNFSHCGFLSENKFKEATFPLYICCDELILVQIDLNIQDIRFFF